MVNIYWMLGIIFALLACIVHYIEWSLLLVLLLVTVSAAAVGGSSAVICHVLLSQKYRAKPKLPVEISEMQKLIMRHAEEGSLLSPPKPAVVFTRSVDTALQEVLDHVLRDYVSSWLKDLTSNHGQLTRLLKNDMWVMLSNLQERLSRIDYVKFITTDVIDHVTHHFEKMRLAQAHVDSKEKNPPTFHLSSHLSSRENEQEYLRRISELIVVVLLPAPYTRCTALQKLMREIFACSLLQPAIDLLCDPDYINLKLLQYIQQQQATASLHQKTYAYAASYEDFIQMIHDCSGIEELKQIRYNIVTEIMQATTISNLKKARGLNPNKDANPQGTGKGDLLQARNLKRYINQLTYAKTQCEKRLKSLGWHSYAAEGSLHRELMPGQKVLSFAIIMESAFTRRFFYRYLEDESQQALLGFWNAVEELRQADRKLWHQLGTEIFYTYVHTPGNSIKVDKAALKRMEAFLIGDKGPEVFYEVQEEMYKTLENQFYPSYLVSDIYHKMILAAENANIDFMQSGCAEEVTSETINPEMQPPENTLHLIDHSNFARRKMDQIDEQLANKTQALQALQTSLKSDSKVLSVLSQEVETLKREQRQLEVHIERTETWSEFIGQWIVFIYSVEIPEEKESPQFVMIVRLPGGKNSPPVNEDYSMGWLVSRKLCDFQELHRKLVQLDSSVKTLELPSQVGKSLFSKGCDKAALEKAKVLLQKYLDAIMQDEKLNKSEAIYAFLSPSPEHLKQSVPLPKKPKFSFTTFFLGSSSNETKEGSKDSDEEDSLLLDDDSNRGDDRKDSIAEPLYALLSEVFDLRGVFKWLRKTLITFVQITYGRTINKQLRDTVEWLFSEQMIIYYIHLFTNSWWPNSNVTTPALPRSDEQKLRTRYEAQKHILNNIPEVLSNLVGQQNARRGANKVYESLQDSRLNKQLFYNIAESFIYTLCPELKRSNDM